MNHKLIAVTTISMLNFLTFACNAQTLHSLIISDTKDDKSTKLALEELQELAKTSNYKLVNKSLIINPNSEKEFFTSLEKMKVEKNDIVFFYLKSNLETVSTSENHTPLVNFEKSFYAISDIHKTIKRMNPRFAITLVDFNNDSKVNQSASIIKSLNLDIKNTFNKESLIKLKGLFKNKGSFLLIGNNGEITESFFKGLKNSLDWNNVISKTSESYFSPFKMEINKLWELDFCEQKNSSNFCFNSRNKSNNKDGNFELSYSIENPNIEKVNYNFNNNLNITNKLNTNKAGNFKETFNFTENYLQKLNSPSNNLKIILDLNDNKELSFERDIVKDLGFYMKRDIPQIVTEARKITDKDIADNPSLKNYQYVLNYSLDENYIDKVKEVNFAMNEKLKYRIISNKDKENNFKEVLYFNDKMLKLFKNEDQNLTLLITYQDGSYNRVYRSIISDLGNIYKNK